MAMADVLFYKSALYPLPLDDADTHGTPRGECVKSLLDLASEKIVQDSTNTHRAVDVVPSELCYNLMRAALLHTRDRSIEILISRWPWKVMCLRKLAPPLFDHVKALYDDNYISERMRRGVKYTTCLAHTFVECLKKRSPTQLKYLDMTGFPAVEVIVNYLSSHVLLVFNEARQKKIITMYNEVTADLPDDQRHKYNIDTTLPDESFVISLDAYIQSEDTHMELCRALKTSKLLPCRFRLQVHSLDLTCLGVARISVLLEQADPKYLTQLCIQYNAISNGGVSILSPIVQRLTSLTCLDMSCNNINITNREDVAAMLADMLASLPQLQRLNLSNNRLKHKLYRILTGLQQPLQYLSLCACGLSEHDLGYLSRSHHAAQLQELDISENNFNSSGNLPKLIVALSGSIRTLQLEDCEFSLGNFSHLLTLLPQCSRLQYLNISRNVELIQSVLEQTVRCLVSMSAFKSLKISFPKEVYTQHDSDFEALEGLKLAFQYNLSSLANLLCKKNNRTDINMLLVDI